MTTIKQKIDLINRIVEKTNSNFKVEYNKKTKYYRIKLGMTSFGSSEVRELERNGFIFNVVFWDSDGLLISLYTERN